MVRLQMDAKLGDPAGWPRLLRNRCGPVGHGGFSRQRGIPSYCTQASGTPTGLC